VRLLSVSVLAGLVGGIASGCGDRTIDSADLESQLDEKFSVQSGVEIESVGCPDEIEAEQGRVFRCTMRVPGGSLVRAEVTLTDDEGGFRAEIPREEFEPGRGSEESPSAP
jgi:hypothetical protein